MKENVKKGTKNAKTFKTRMEKKKKISTAVKN